MTEKKENKKEKNINWHEFYNFNSIGFKIARTFPVLILLAILLSPIWTAIFNLEQFLLYYVVILSLYWTYRILLSTVAIYIGYKRMQKDIKTDWNKSIKKLIKNWKSLPDPDSLPESYDNFMNVILIPVYKEPKGILIRTLNGLKNSEFDIKNKVIIVFAVEERGGKEILQSIKELQKEYKEFFKDFKYYVHPANIPGEAVGIAGPNLNWASRQFVKDLKNMGKDISNYLVTKIDSDTVLHPKFIGALTYKYLTTPQRYNHFFSNAIKLYSNNYWKTPLFSRLFVGSLSIAILIEWILYKKIRQSFSTYCFNLKLLHDMDYLDPWIGVDDTGFYWRAYLYTNGDFYAEEFYIPSYSDAVEAGSIYKTYKAQYKQLLRWGAGYIVMPVFLQAMIKKKDLPLKKKLRSTYVLFWVYTLMTSMSFILAFAIPIVNLINPSVSFLSPFHIIPKIISFLMSISLIGFIPFRIILEKLYGPPPKTRGKIFYIWHYFEQIFLIINAMVFFTIPYVHAQINILLGKFGRYYVTEKRI